MAKRRTAAQAAASRRNLEKARAAKKMGSQGYVDYKGNPITKAQFRISHGPGIGANLSTAQINHFAGLKMAGKKIRKGRTKKLR